MNSLWNTDQADLSFSDENTHEFYLGEAGQSFYWDDLTLSGILHVAGDAYFYADEVVGLDLFNFAITGNGRIYFDALDANNAYLLSYTNGYNYLAAYYEGSSVPEPATVLFLIIGFLGLKTVRKILARR